MLQFKLEDDGTFELTVNTRVFQGKLPSESSFYWENNVLYIIRDGIEVAIGKWQAWGPGWKWVPKVFTEIGFTAGDAVITFSPFTVEGTIDKVCFEIET